MQKNNGFFKMFPEIIPKIYIYVYYVQIQLHFFVLAL